MHPEVPENPVFVQAQQVPEIDVYPYPQVKHADNEQVKQFAPQDMHKLPERVKVSKQFVHTVELEHTEHPAEQATQ